MRTENTNKIRLSNYERETIINFNEEEPTASVYTCSKALIKKMDTLCAKIPDLYRLKRQDGFSKTYEFPKKYLTIRKLQPNKARNNAASRFKPGRTVSCGISSSQNNQAL